MTPENRKKLIRELRYDEGVKPSIYYDSLGYPTIGIGKLIAKRHGVSKAEAARIVSGWIGRPFGPASRLTDDEMDRLLDDEVEKVISGLNRSLPWWVELNDARQRVLVNMAFNLGLTGLLGFKNTLAMVRAGNYAGAARGMLASKWARQVKGRSTRLSQMMEYGQDHPGYGPLIA